MQLSFRDAVVARSDEFVPKAEDVITAADDLKSKDLLDEPGYRPWCRHRPATGTGTAPDFPPARPRPLHTKERIA